MHRRAAPAFMEAPANLTARPRPGGPPRSGLNIVLPHEQAPNEYVTAGSVLQLPLFRDPQDAFPDAGPRAICIFPGGFGTLDEMFEKPDPDPDRADGTGALPCCSAAISGSGSSTGDALAEAGTISPEDLDCSAMSETAEEPVEALDHWAGAERKSADIIPGR